ncbi:ABC transporter permease [Novosphingobium ginsenosidimutans]|uniref:Transport permease protein n=1 Tax=Novosphingobium ginsenosidimutans TaxID=1176536 RepID=A0A5B8S5R0_9SPHN|nr:ABC transporter permease [Novosphingobium ginsenosidimutans]QEA16919.1 ABC transporter permease [Novosphingobium ginsenosidimutans]
MSGALVRIMAMALKELAVVLRDRRVLTTLVASPVIQLVLFGLATTLEVKNVSLGLVNRDTGIASEQFLAAVGATRNVGEVIVYPNEKALGEAIEQREVLGGLILPPDLSARVARGEGGEIGLLLDGRRVNAAQIVTAYLSEIAATTGLALQPGASGPDLAVRNWYNPNLDYSWFTLPGMIAVITTVLVLSVSVQAVAREREFGTYDQLMALPMRHWEILLGKAVPAFLVGLFNGSFYVTMVAWLSDVPFLGSYALIVLAIAAFSLAVSSIGLAISSVAANQQQAFLGGFLVIVPMILLSGYASPIDGMPAWLQPIAAVDPLSHLLAVCHGVFLKNMPSAMIMDHIWPMILVSIIAFGVGHTLLRGRSN